MNTERGNIHTNIAGFVKLYILFYSLCQSHKISLSMSCFPFSVLSFSLSPCHRILQGVDQWCLMSFCGWFWVVVSLKLESVSKSVVVKIKGGGEFWSTVARPGGALVGFDQ